MRLFIIRYLWTVSHHFRYSAAGFVLLGAFAIWALGAMPADRGAPFVPIMLLQMFAASSGFRQAADDGCFDVLLTSGPSRFRIVMLHVLASVGPGVTCWLAVGLLERGWHGDVAVGFGAGPVVGLLLVSALSWAISALTARLAGGLVWLMALVAVAVSPDGIVWLGTAFTESPVGVAGVARQVAVFLVCPFLFLVPQAATSAADPRLLVAVSLLGVGAASGTAWWMTWRDYRGRA